MTCPPSCGVSNRLRCLQRFLGTSMPSMRTASSFSVRRALAAFGFWPTAATPVPPIILPTNIPIKEELTPRYDPQFFYPVNPGDIFINRYEMMAKIGCGSCSTVWLARDTRRFKWRSNRYVAVKVNNCDFANEASADQEVNISRCIAQANPSHRGFPFVRTILDSFKIKGPHGNHVCLVFEAMREPSGCLRNGAKMVDYHFRSSDHIVHTDIKTDNIMVGFEDPSVISDFAQAQTQNPMARKVRDGRFVYLSHNNFGPLKSSFILPIISDFGLAQYGNSGLQRHPTQSDHYRAPEVILGAGWTYSADIWNLGVLLWNLLEKRDLFREILSSQGRYSAQAHIAEMIALLGPPPKELIDREKEGLGWRFRPEVENRDGKLCGTASEFYGGPFFDSDGEFMHKELIPDKFNLADSVLSIEGADKEEFLNFIPKILQWLPEKRKSANELLDDPWLSPESIQKNT